eukprot:3190596-Rhodomonas_salina.1
MLCNGTIVQGTPGFNNSNTYQGRRKTLGLPQIRTYPVTVGNCTPPYAYSWVRVPGRFLPLFPRYSSSSSRDVCGICGISFFLKPSPTSHRVPGYFLVTRSESRLYHNSKACTGPQCSHAFP